MDGEVECDVVEGPSSLITEEEVSKTLRHSKI